MIAKTMKYFTNVVVKVLSLLFLFQFSACLTMRGQTQDLANILSTLSPVAGKLTGYKITALETNITFNQNNSALEILQSDIKTNFTKSQIAALKELSRNNMGVVTNTCFYVFRFGNGVIYISREQFNTLGKLTQKDTVFVTADEVREYHNPVEAVDGYGGNTGWSVIRNRETNVLFGLPVFLSKSTLHDWIKSSSVQICETGKSLAGQDCDIITISGEPHTPIEKYKLFLRLDTFSPVGFDSYLADGTLHSHTDLQFEEPGNAPFVCKRADNQTFRKGELSRQSVWIVERVEADNIPLAENVESFIPPKTRVLDQRFSKSLNYHMGVRPPNSDQINLMLTSTNGVASYESGIIIHAGTTKISSEKRNLIRGIFIAFIILSFLIFLLKFFKKR